MLVAYNKRHQMITPKIAQRNDELFCYSCNERVVLKRGSFKIAHFAHQKGNNCNTFSEGETKEHLVGKKQILKFFSKEKYNPILEYYFTKIKQRPDILLNQNLAIEFQCSPITSKRLSERLAGYEHINCQSIWILGSHYLKKRTNGKKLKQFLMYDSHLGFYLMYWDIKNHQMIIQHHIRFSLNKLIYQTIFIKQHAELDKLFNNSIRMNVDDDDNNIAIKLKRNIIRNQQQLVLNQNKSLLIQRFCYQWGYNFAGYPLELDYPWFDIPLLGNRLIEYKVVMLLLLKKYSSISMFKLIYKSAEQLLIEFEFYMINKNIVFKAISSILFKWQVQNIVEIKLGVITLKAFPKWYSSYDLKWQAVDQFIKKGTNF